MDPNLSKVVDLVAGDEVNEGSKQDQTIEVVKQFANAKFEFN